MIGQRAAEGVLLLMMGRPPSFGPPALRRVPQSVPGQRRRVLRFLLRLLPARGLRPAHRHVHREGGVHQREIERLRNSATRSLLERSRRHHRGVGVLHLRPGLARVLPGHGHPAHVKGRQVIDRDDMLRRCRASSTSATPIDLRATGPFACAATWSRSSRLRGRAHRAHRVLRRRDREHGRSIPCAARCSRSSSVGVDLPGQPLRHPRRPLMQAAAIHRGRAGRAHLESCAAGQAARGAAPRAAHALRPRDAQRIGHCPGIENYSRHLDGRAPGEAPATLLATSPTTS